MASTPGVESIHSSAMKGACSGYAAANTAVMTEKTKKLQLIDCGNKWQII